MPQSIKHKKTQLPVFMSVALDRMRGSIVITDRTINLVINQLHRDVKTGLFVQGCFYHWKTDERLIFLGIEANWKCADNGRRRGHLMILTPAGIGYLHPRDSSTVRLFSEVRDEDKEDIQRRIDQDR